jgi:deoxyribonuclease I
MRTYARHLAKQIGTQDCSSAEEAHTGHLASPPLRLVTADQTGPLRWPVTKHHAASLKSRNEKALTSTHLRADACQRRRASQQMQALRLGFNPGLFEGLEDEALLRAIRAYTSPHTVKNWNEARRLMADDVDNIDGWIICPYTGRRIPDHGIPDGKDMNIEHSWPKSQGFEEVVGTPAETDMHHLFFTDTEANGRRSSLSFGNVSKATWEKGPFKIGFDNRGTLVAEPPDNFKGDIARAHFYIAATYNLHIPPEEEVVLKAWNQLDPVDDKERLRCAKIEKYQGKPNPFVNDSSLADRIRDF